jgi:NodT family efflux transporter outer membrane factor (OMF) lipoprotein
MKHIASSDEPLRRPEQSEGSGVHPTTSSGGFVAALGTTLLGVSLLVSGCMVGPDFKRPEPTTMPSTVVSPLAPAPLPSYASTMPTSKPATRPASIAIREAQPVIEWWSTFNDPVLTSLVQRAIEANLDLKFATARLRQARAARRVVAAGFWPNVDVSGSYARSGSGNRSPTSGSNDAYRAGLDATWEMDIFGGVRRGVEAAEADIQTAAEDRRGVLVSLAAEVALDYLDLRGFQRELRIANENLESQRYSAELTRKRQAAGYITLLDVANSDAQLASTQSQIPLLQQSSQQTIYALSLLLSREPGALVDELSPEGTLPTVPPVVPIGLPSDLLQRRPDIRAAEAALHAATARVGVATADLFPRFALNASVGLLGSKPASLFNWGNRFWSIGPAVSWPLFDAGRIRAQIEVQNAVQEQALIQYQQTVLTALNEVETALVAYAREQEHREALTRAVGANRKALELSTTLYREGKVGFLEVLTAQRSLYVSEDALVQSDRIVAQNLVALYKALGGGWEIELPPTTQPATMPVAIK